ncbi:M20/M25/M40 family metallo-hydrolase [Alphaproteobacteria bacterium]|nr:M20/M25/M40 family metallo-hydrolase [Alphaproteobacteria bacterium]
MISSYEDAKRSVLSAIEFDRQDLIDLCLDLGNLRDYPGYEREVGERVAAWLEDAGLSVRTQTLSPDSINVIGTIRGVGDRAGGGRSLILNAHMDTQGAAPEGDEETERKIRGAWTKDGLLYGRGLANDKAQLAAELIAVRAIAAMGIALKENLFVTAVAQETSAPTDDPEELRDWSGVGPAISQVREGYGARWLVEQGVVADYALVAEVSDFTVTVGQAGYLRLRISVPGNIPYTPGLDRGNGVAGNPNPFERAAHVMVALEEWARRYETENHQEFWGGTFIPKAQIYEVAGSGPAWTEMQDFCHVYLDIRLTPDAVPADLINSVQRQLAPLRLDCEIVPYDYRRGYIAENCEPLLNALQSAHKEVLGDGLELASPRMISMWRDANAFNEAGIIAIGYGPPTLDAIGAGLAGATRPIAIDDLLATTKVIALTSLTICGVADGR